MRTTVVTVTCDFCGYGGPLSRPEDFTSSASGVDLCRWCSMTRTGPGRLECGVHRIEITEDTWTCSCGETFVRPMFVSPRVLEAVPSVLHATARIHSEKVMA